jgi:hypothetical protein
MGEISRYTPACPMQSNVLRPRILVSDPYGNIDLNAYPNRCMRCRSDEGNWNCDKYNDFMNDLPGQETGGVIIPLVPDPMTPEYRKVINA